MQKVYCHYCKKRFKSDIYVGFSFSEYNLCSCPYCDYVGMIRMIFVYNKESKKQQKEAVLI